MFRALTQWLGAPRTETRPAPRPKLQLRCEGLEERAVPATFYVDDQYTGATPAPGNTSNTFQTIAQVEAFQTDAETARDFNAGDKILFKSGRTWREQLDVPRDGLTFGAYHLSGGTKVEGLQSPTSAKPVISGSNSRTGWYDNDGDGVWGLDGFAAKPFVITRGGVWQNEAASEAAVNSTNTWFWDPVKKNVSFYSPGGNPGSAVEFGERDAAVSVKEKNSTLIKDLQLEKTNNSAVLFFTNSSTSGKNENNTVQNCLIRLSNSKDGPITGPENTADDQQGAGLHVRLGRNNAIIGCTLRELRGDGIFFTNSRDVRVEYNDVGAVYRARDNINADCISVAGSKMGNSDGFRIVGNTCTQQGTNSPKGCIIVDNGRYGYVAENTCSWGNFGASIEASYTLVERNTFLYQGKASGHEWASGIYDGDPQSDTTDVTFRYNVVFDAMNGIRISSRTDESGNKVYKNRQNYSFYNNTVADCHVFGVFIDQPTSGAFKNNIVWCDDATERLIRFDTLLPGGGFVSNYNIIGPGRADFYEVRWLGTSYDSLLAYRTATGGDERPYASDTVFASTDPAAANFLRLASSSAAKNQGTNEFYISTAEDWSRGNKDRAGNPALYTAGPTGLVDIGAYEFQGI